MSASNPGPGRPPGISEATLERQRRVRAMHAKGIPIATIAAAEDRVPGYIRMLINGGVKEDGSPDEPGADIVPPQPRKLSRRTAQYRAWEIVQQRPVPGLGLDANAFWIRLIVEIHDTGDGFRLRIGESAARFAERSDLAILFARSDQLEIDDWLKGLFARGRLIDINGIDIGIPHGMKLTPAENIRAKAVAKRSAQAAPDRQPPLLHAVSGGLSDANEIPPQTQIKFQLNLRDDANSIPNGATENANTIPVIAVTHTAAAATTAQKDQSLNSSSSIGSCAGDGELNLHSGGIESAPGAGETRPDANEIILQRSSIGTLADQLMALAGIVRLAKPDEVGVVESWIKKGYRIDAARGVIEAKMTQRNGKPPRTLLYFGDLMDEALGPKATASVIALPQTAAPAPAAPALSEADEAIRNRLAAPEAAHLRDFSGCAWPPSLADFGAKPEIATRAHRWLDVWDACHKAGRTRELKLPNFPNLSRETFDADMERIEEALTAPDPEAAD